MNIYKKIILCLLLNSFILAQCESYELGDANADNSLDILDVVIIVDIIFEQENLDDFYSLDINQDEILNVIDIVILLNRILDIYPLEVNITNIQYDFSNIIVEWEQSTDYGFSKYNIFYSNFFDNEQVLLYTSEDITQTSVIISDINLKEQNFFWITIEDFLGCELIGQQYLYELPYKNYLLDDFGSIVDTEFNINDFSSSTECIGCHQEYVEEWSGSMHAYTMQSPIFFAYKNENKNIHPSTGEKFCMQCHNPISYLTGTDLSIYNNPNDFQSSNIEQVLKEGITCDVCHTRTGLSQTVHGTGNMAANAIYRMYPTGNIKFGSIMNPVPNDYHDSYYLPTYESSQLCLPCHDLVINNIEAEITFTEWNRIPGFSMFGGVSCQDCHMPIKENGKHDHRFVGVDLDLSIPITENPLYDDVAELLSTSATIHFDILGDTIQNIINVGDTLQIPMSVISQTGHNFPSGTSFNREAWIELKVMHDENIIFSSGLINNTENLDTNDENLLLFTSELFDSSNNITNNITEVYSMDNTTLMPYQTRFHYYNVLIPDNISGNITVTARLLFRSFKPNFISEHHPEFLNNLPIFEISSITSNIEIQ